MILSSRDHVNSFLNKTQADANAHPNAETQTSDDQRPIALYDLPPGHPQSREHVIGPRQPRSTERNVQYQATRTDDEGKRLWANDTRARNRSCRSNARCRHTDDAPEHEGSDNSHTQAVSDTGRRRRNRKRKRTRATRSISSSPSLGSTDCERDQPVQTQNGPELDQPTQTQSNSQYTYIYESLDRERFIEFAQKKLGIELQAVDTQAVASQLRDAKAKQKAQVGSTRRPSSIVLLPPTPLNVAGGWSQEVVGGSRSTAPLSANQRASDASARSNQSSKRQRIAVEVEDDTAMEPETEDEPVEPPNASIHSLGSSLPPPRVRPLPNILYPVSGPVHNRLRSEALNRHFFDVDREAEAVDVAPIDVDEVPKTEFDSASSVSHRATHGLQPITHTYAGRRSHLPSQSQADQSGLDDTNNGAEEPIRPNSPTLTPSQLIWRERVQAVAARAHSQMAELAPRRPSRLFASVSQAPASRSQARPPVRSQGRSSGSLGGPRRLDPTAAARADMLAFNCSMAQGEATSFVEAVTRQSERDARCAAPESRPRDDLLEDDEEMLAQAEAFIKGTWPRPARSRKPKPLQRDVSGIERQVLVMAKIHLFAYALVEGIYQTRATFLRWAAAVHEATWQMELPDWPYERPHNDILEIMVNNIATLRGKAKERLREFVVRVAGFQQNLKNCNTIRNNLNQFNDIYPNAFHCQSSDPRKGDYKHPELGHCISLIIFNSPNSVGVLYPDDFREMPLTVVAFCLAIWQYCIEEWSTGWRQNGDLGTSAMREKYESHLAGLKELREIAPRRVRQLQDEWRDYAFEYSGAIFVPDNDNRTPAQQSQMRPDTPEPNNNAISVEEMEARLFETACQESMRKQVAAMAAQELEIIDVEDEVEDELESRVPTPLPVEYNEHGVLTASSKGKERAD